MKKRKMLSLLLILAMSVSVCACSGNKKEEKSIAGDTNNDGQIDMGIEEDVEVDQGNAAEHMNSYDASTSGNWEAMFTPIEMEGRAIDMADFDLTPTKEEQIGRAHV